MNYFVCISLVSVVMASERADGAQCRGCLTQMFRMFQSHFVLWITLVFRFRNTVSDRTGWRRHRVFCDVCDPSPHTWQTAPCVRHPKLLYCYLGIALLGA